MKRLITNLRKKAKRKRAVLETKLMRLRAKMAKDLMIANKNGDIGLCKKGNKNIEDRENYCNSNYIDDFVRNRDCKHQKQFAHLNTSHNQWSQRSRCQEARWHQ